MPLASLKYFRPGYTMHALQNMIKQAFSGSSFNERNRGSVTESHSSNAPSPTIDKTQNSYKDVIRFVLNEDGICLYASKGFFDVMQVKEEDVLGKPASSFIHFKGNKDKAAFTLPEDGIHKIKLQAPQGHDFGFSAFQCDWVQSKTGDNVFIASSDAEQQKHNKRRGESDEQKQARTALLQRFVQRVTRSSEDDDSQGKNQENGKAVAANDSNAGITNNPHAKVEPRSLSSEEHNAFSAMSTELHAIIRPDGRFECHNENFSRLLGYNSEELKNVSFLELIHSDDKTNVKNALFSLSGDARVHSIAPSTYFEARIEGKSGGLFWIEWQVKNIRNTLYALGRDVTEIKQNEHKLRYREQQLSEAQELAHMGHWRWVTGESEIRWSDQLFQIFDQDPTAFTPSIENVNKVVHRRDTGRVIQAFQRAIIEKRNYDIDFRIYRKDGSIRYVHCEGRCEFDDDGEVVALFGIMQDETERLQHERDLKEAKEAVEQAYAAKSRFLANMSHELRTPLNAIIGFSEMMQRQLLGPIGTEKYLDYIAGIRESGEHLLDLISDILDMSRIEAGKYELDIENLNIAKIGRLALHMMEGRAVDAGVSLTSEIEDEDLTLQADRRAVMQIMLNLLSNAIKFTKSGGCVCLRLSTDEQKGMVKLTVSDTGIGIPSHKIPTITNAFEQVDNDYAKEYEGSGLGLSITKDLAELHNGRIDIVSEIDKGTKVTISLPLKYKAKQGSTGVSLQRDAA